MKTLVLEDQLQKYFHYNSFRTGQKEIIQDVLAGKDVLGVLPTGSGKSICYQLPALLLDGITVVVSPLISLMLDQVKELKAKNIKPAVALNSFINPFERRKLYHQLHQYKIIFVSPELLQQEEFIFHLERQQISLLVIDEAHCISQWGHEFRPDYLKLKSVIQQLQNPTVLALSATATPVVQTDIIETLERSAMKKHIYPMDRDNIVLNVKKVDNNEEKLEAIINILTKYSVPTMIYFSSRQAAETTTQILTHRLQHRRIAFYHGGMETVDRISIQQQFMNNQLDVVCCTSAFGMGINKNDIRLVIHYHFPPQIESYIQEIGRAGRDGRQSVSLLLYSQTDDFLPKQMIENELPTEEQLRFSLEVIKQYGLQNMEFPNTLEKLLPVLQLNEIQWRFLHHQLEKHGMMKGNRVIATSGNWNSVLKKINQLRIDRLTIKERKLYEIIHWMNEERCLRKELYTKFQDSFSPPIGPCCSNCGFVWENWEPHYHSSERKDSVYWKDKLKQLLIIGEGNE